MKIPDYMVEKLKELEELRKESKKLQGLVYPEIAKKYPLKEIDSEILLWVSLCQYEKFLEERNQEYKTKLEKTQKNNSCDNTSQ